MNENRFFREGKLVTAQWQRETGSSIWLLLEVERAK